MLFIANKPTQLLISPQNKILITTQHQLYFTNLHFIQQYLVTNLSFYNPLAIQYASETAQALVATAHSLELYWTDWSHQIHLHVLICLNNQKIYTMVWQSGWQVYGQFKQYSPKKIHLWRIQSIDQSFPSCYQGESQYVMNKKHLMIYNHRKKQHQIIEWAEAADYLKQIHRKKPFMKVHLLGNQVELLQVQDMLLYIREGVVHHTLNLGGELMVTGRVATWLSHGKMKIYTFEEECINNHGDMDVFDGHFYGAAISNDKMLMLFYDFKQIKVRSINLVSEEQNQAYELAKIQKNKFRHHQNLFEHKSPSMRMKKIETVDLGHEQNNSCEFETKSEMNHLLGANLRNALKSSIGRFKEEFDKSHEEQKFDDNMEPNNEPQFQEERKQENYYSIERNRKQSFGTDMVVQQATENQRPQNYEQNIDNLNRHNTSHQATSNISDNVPAQTPAFSTLEADFGDKWNHFQGQWDYSQLKKQKIEVIHESDEKQHYSNMQSSSYEKAKPVVAPEQSDGESMEIEFVQSQNQSQEQLRGSASSVIKEKAMPTEKQAERSSNIIHHSIQGKGSDSKSSKRRILRSNIQIDELFNMEQSDHDHNFQLQLFDIPKEPESATLQVNNHSLNFNRKISEELNKNKTEIESEFNLSRVLKPVIIEQKRKYTQMLSSIYRKRPQEFDSKLEQYMYGVIRQKEARLFFAQHIRNFNVQRTKDKLIRLYKSLQDNSQNRKYMTEALSEFKLHEVPSACLAFDDTFIGVFRLIHPEVYVEDLLEPSGRVIEDILNHYFKKNLTGKVIVLEGMKIQIELPRNMLNILLFLNENFQLPIQNIFEIYTKKMVQHGFVEIIQRIVESNVPKICGVETIVIQDAIQYAVYELLGEKMVDFCLIEKAIPLMKAKKGKIYSVMIDLMQNFSISGIIFDTQSLLELPNTRSSDSFIKDIISLNCAQVLTKLDFPSMLKMMSFIKDGKIEHYYSAENIEATKKISIKLISEGYLREGFANLTPISPLLSQAFLVRLLVNHVKGFFANRLVNTTIKTEVDFKDIFHEILVGRKTPKEGDPFPTDICQTSAAISWDQFNEVASEIIPESPWELRYIIYSDSKLAHDLIEENIISKEQIKICFRELGIIYRSQYTFEGLEKEKDDLRIKFREGSSASCESGQIAEVKRSKKARKIKAIGSLKGSDKQVPMKLSQYSNSMREDPMKNHGSSHYDLVLSVEPSQTINLLREYYQTESLEQFLQTVKLTDFQRININSQNISKLKSTLNLKLNFYYKSLIPFEYFFDEKQAWNITSVFLATRLTTDNFWIIYLIIDILYDQRSEDVVKLFLEKLILTDRDDSWSTAVSDILKEISLPPQFLKKTALSALEMGLFSMNKTLLSHLSSL